MSNINHLHTAKIYLLEEAKETKSHLFVLYSSKRIYKKYKMAAE